MTEIKIRFGKKEDVPSIHKLIMALAKFENAENEVEVSVEELITDGFSENPVYKVLVAEIDNKIAGLALFYIKYSTWKGKCIYLEDFIVDESLRGKGIGKILFESVAKEANKINAKRMEWQVLDWNEVGINFYKKYNAILDSGWINCKLTSELLQKL